jgi:hypothetical protein
MTGKSSFLTTLVFGSKNLAFHYFTVSLLEVWASFFQETMIFDISLLLPSYQKEFVENFLNELWIARITDNNPRKRTLLVFEEFQLYGRNTRGLDSQNILRIMSVGANRKMRVLGITPDLSLVDCAFIRLAQQRYHFKLGNEPNAKRRFSRYYGKDSTYTARHLDVGFCLYCLKEETPQVYKVPLFTSKTRPQEYCEPTPKKREPRTLKEKVLSVLNNKEFFEQEDEFEEEDYPILEELDSL